MFISYKAASKLERKLVDSMLNLYFVHWLQIKKDRGFFPISLISVSKTFRLFVAVVVVGSVVVHFAIVLQPKNLVGYRS